jgi:hypothetical protein
MWIEKLFLGVLQIVTPLGPRFVRPPLSQRIYLLWIFRHFRTLPIQVLSSRQQRLIDSLCSQRSLLVSIQELGDMSDSPVLGTVDWRPRVDENELPPRRPSASVPGFVAGMRQRL